MDTGMINKILALASQFQFQVPTEAIAITVWVLGLEIALD
jgi:hypothetical protein